MNAPTASAPDPVAPQPPPATVPPPLRRPPGILCPVCGVKPYIRRTKLRRDNSISRKRKCPQCGLVVTTFERVQAAPAG